MKRKHILFSFIMTFMFLTASVIGPDILSFIKQPSNTTVAYARPRSSSGGYKSGGFKSHSSSSSGSYKSGGFFKSTKSNTNTSQKYNSTQKTKKTYIPLPIPIPWGSHGSYGGGYAGYAIWKLIKLIIIIALIMYIIKKIKRR